MYFLLSLFLLLSPAGADSTATADSSKTVKATKDLPLEPGRTVAFTGGTATRIRDPVRMESASFPARKLTQIGAQFPSWSHDGKKVHWSIGNAHIVYDLDAATAFADSVKAGGIAGVGAHGQLEGLGYRWELWSVHSGGMSNHDSLRTATVPGGKE